jgi:PAS domain S-box-containing protein
MSDIRNKRFLYGSVVFIFIIVLFLEVSKIWQGMDTYETYRDNYLQTIHDEVELIGKHLETQLDINRNQTKIFANVFKDSLVSLIRNPSNHVLVEEVRRNIEDTLPGAISFNVADANGNILLHEESLSSSGECGEDVIAHLNTNEISRILQIHEVPGKDHYDILVNWESDSTSGVFIVSYDPAELAHTLSQKVTQGNRLLLLKHDTGGLVEIAEKGVREQLSRQPRLSDDERNRIGHWKKIAGSDWVLVEVYPANLFASKRDEITYEILLSSIATFVIFIFLVTQINREKSRAWNAESFLSSIIDNLPGVVFRAELPVNGELSYSFISSGAEDILGYDSKDLQVDSKVLFRAAHAEDITEVYDRMQESALHLTPLRIEYRVIRKGGSYLWVREIARPQKNRNGDIIWSGIMLDISDLKQTEQKLFTHYSALNATSDSILITDPHGLVEWVNPALCELTGFTQEDMLLRNLDCLIESDNKENLPISKAIDNNSGWKGEMIFHRKDGSAFSADTSLTPVLGPTGKIRNFIAIVRDLTEKKMLETQLLQAQKMESIGQLAAGIAHEINTPTQFVGDNVHFLKGVVEDFIDSMDKLKSLKQRLEEQELQVVAQEIGKMLQRVDIDFIEEEAPAAINQSLDGLSRIAKIVGAMKDFSHPGSNSREVIDLNRVIDSTITIARNEWKYVAEMKTDLAPDLPGVEGDSQVIGQTILNLIVNAAHAIEEKHGEAASSDKGLIQISTRVTDSWVELRVTDNGIGIPENIKQRIFEPFFTTKEVGKGSGQGLAIAYSGIVEKHGGHIDIESVVGEGTSFIILLPQ